MNRYRPLIGFQRGPFPAYRGGSPKLCGDHTTWRVCFNEGGRWLSGMVVFHKYVIPITFYVCSSVFLSLEKYIEK